MTAYEVIDGQVLVARALTQEHSKVVGRGLADALAMHALDRLDDIDDIIAWAGDHLSSARVASEKWSPEAVHRYVQLDVPPHWSAADAEV